MPISRELEQCYPDNWQEIRAAVLERSTDKEVDFVRGLAEWGNDPPDVDDSPPPTDDLDDRPRCEWCGAPNKTRLFRWERYWSFAGNAQWYGPAGGEAVFHGEVPAPSDVRRTEIVLTTAHLCHFPPCEDLGHLRALCQACHLWYDGRPRQREARESITAELAGQTTLFDSRTNGGRECPHRGADMSVDEKTGAVKVRREAREARR